VRTLLVIALLLVAGCSTSPAIYNNSIPLVWKPDREKPARMPNTDPAVMNAKLKVPVFIDKRAKTDVIGENYLRPETREVTTKDNVATFVTHRFVNLLSAAGLNMVQTGETAVVSVEIEKFVVTETGDYVGLVVLNIIVSDPQGQARWRGTITGSSQRFGVSDNSRNYYESLSDAMILATNYLLYDPGFQKAIAGN
jgi:hypothetical protein